MVRKSPFRHKVRKYTRRDGTVVQMYHRGKGKKPRARRRARERVKPSKVRRGLKAPSTPFRNFHVSVTFPDGKRESVPSVNATSYAQAIDKGLTARKRPNAPKSILIRRIE